MSSIYIPNMEMPTEEQSVITINIYADGVVTCYDDDVERKAIPVPDHGRLIDADALDADLENQDMKTGEWDAIGFSIYEIENAPTIIPADKERDGWIEQERKAMLKSLPKWISVKEHLPEKPYGCLLLVWDSPYDGGDDFLNYLPRFAGWDGERWNDSDGQQVPFEVEYWMPLPEPPREEQT